MTDTRTPGPAPMFSSNTGDWYTPLEIVEAVRDLFDGRIDLDPPPADVEWFPGTTRPSWLISVTAAAAADAIDGAPATTVAGADPGYNNKNAQRVVVTINGGGDADGATQRDAAKIAEAAGYGAVARSRIDLRRAGQGGGDDHAAEIQLGIDADRNGRGGRVLLGRGGLARRRA